MNPEVFKIEMGLGDAIMRLIKVVETFKKGRNRDTKALTDEMEMIVQALNLNIIELGMDCDGDGIPDVPADKLFKESVTTSCCRIKPKDSSRKATSRKSRKNK